jgi:hypothetical protein
MTYALSNTRRKKTDYIKGEIQQKIHQITNRGGKYRVKLQK